MSDSSLVPNTSELPGHAYKLATGPAAGGYGLNVVIPDSIDVDERRMALWIPFADGQRRDGVGDLLDVAGIRTERHRANPLVLWDHGKSVTFPLGSSEDPESHEYTVFIDPVAQLAKGCCYFYQGKGMPGVDRKDEYDHAVFCGQVFDLMVKRFVRGGSIGYQVIDAEPIPPDYRTGTPAGQFLKSVTLLEYSAVVMPCNQDTVRKVLDLPSVCGKPLSPVLIKSFAPYAPERKATMGYEGKSESSLPTNSADRVPVPLDEDLSKTKLPPVHADPGYIDQSKKGYNPDFNPAHPDNRYIVTEVGNRFVVLNPYQDQHDRRIGQAVSHFEFLDPVKAQEKADKLNSYARRQGYQKSQMAGDLNWLKEEEAEAEHKRMKSLRKKYKSRPRLSQGKGMADNRGAWKVEAWEEPNGPTHSLQVVNGHVSGNTVGVPPAVLRGISERPVGSVGYAGENIGNWYWEGSGGWKSHGEKSLGNPIQRQVQEAISRNSQEGSRGISWTFDHLTQQERDAFDKWLADTKHPLAYEPGTQESRFVQFVRNGGKSLDTRSKYRRSKGRFLRRKKGSPGIGIVHIHGKDMGAVQEEATHKRLKLERIGTGKDGAGTEKVRLTGDDKAIEEIATKYGVRAMGTKSTKAHGTWLNNPRTKKEIKEEIRRLEDLLDTNLDPALHTSTQVLNGIRDRIKELYVKLEKAPSKSLNGRNDMAAKTLIKRTKDLEPEDVIEEEETVEEAEKDFGAPETDEKYSAQVLRRLHEDASLLLGHYDELGGPLEHEDISGHLRSKCERLVEELEEIEALMEKHHPEAKKLGSSDEDDGLPGEDEDYNESDVEEADSMGEEEVPPEEALEGMETKRLIAKGKSLRGKYGKKFLRRQTKSAPCRCPKGTKNCKCGKKSVGRKDMTEDEMEHVQDVMEESFEDTEEDKGLDDRDRSLVSDASGFLKGIGEGGEWTTQGRMDAYYHHKSLGGIAGTAIGAAVGGPVGGAIGGAIGEHVTSAMDDEEKEEKDFDEAVNRAEEEIDDETEKAIHPHRKACKGASAFCKELSDAEELSDEHRTKAMGWHKELDPISQAGEMADVTEGDGNDALEPGEMGEKARPNNRIKSLLATQRKQIDELKKSLASLNL